MDSGPVGPCVRQTRHAVAQVQTRSAVSPVPEHVEGPGVEGSCLSWVGAPALPIIRIERGQVNKSRITDIARLLQENVDREAVARGRERMTCVAQNQRPDYLPIAIGVDKSPLFDQVNGYNFKEEFYDDEKMLANQLILMLGYLLAHSDNQIVIRANLGAPFLATSFCLDVRVFEHTKPWLVDHLNRAAYEGLDIDGMLAQVEESGQISRAISLYAYYRDVLAEVGLDDMVNFYLPDTQGPFDLAHLVYGNDIFLEMHDDPAFVHELMTACTELFIRATRVLKHSLGEKTGQMYHQANNGRYFFATAGTRSCEDTSILISPAAIDEFVAPYLQRAAQAFDGLFVHFCGEGNHLLRRLQEIPEVACFNFGTPENYDFDQVLPALIERGKYYVGKIPREPQETTEGYLRRILGYLQGQRRGLVLWADLEGSVDAAKGQQTRDLWYELQDRMLDQEGTT